MRLLVAQETHNLCLAGACAISFAIQRLLLSTRSNAVMTTTLSSQSYQDNQEIGGREVHRRSHLVLSAVSNGVGVPHGLIRSRVAGVTHRRCWNALRLLEEGGGGDVAYVQDICVHH